MTARTYHVEYRYAHNRSGLDWWLFTHGDGHWCVGTGHSGSFRTEAEADAAGREWVATGRDASARVHTKLSQGHPLRPDGGGTVATNPTNEKRAA